MLGNIATLLFMLFGCLSITFPEGEGSLPECSLLLPACLKSLEMGDSCLFPLFPFEGEIRAEISSGERKKVFLQNMTFSLYEYPEGAEPVVTKDGKVLLLHGAEAPIAALDYRGNVALDALRKRDGVLWGGGVIDLLKGEIGWINLQFNRKKGSTRAVLLFEGNATSSASRRIASRLLNALREKKGEDGRRLEDLDKDKQFVKEMRKWMEEELALHIRLWNGSEWKEAASALPWLSMRRAGFPLNLKGMPRGDLKVRIELPPSLWKIDRVALDFAPVGPIRAVHTFSMKGNKREAISKAMEKSISVPRSSSTHPRAGLVSVKGYYNIEAPQWIP